MSLLLNHRQIHGRSNKFLKVSDNAIRNIIENKDESQWVREVKDGYRLLKIDADNEIDSTELAADYFYSHLVPKKIGGRIQVEYQLSNVFAEMLVTSFKGQEVKKLIPTEEYAKRYGNNHEDFYFSCLVGYLIKNFWHNYTHRHLQAVDTHRYRDFGGHSDYEGDFQADVCAELLTVCSYGVNPKVFTKSHIVNSDAAYISLIQKMSRTARPFEERARQRKKDKYPSKDAYLEEREWRIRRNLQGELVRLMLVKGYFPGSVSIYFPGDVNLVKGYHERDSERNICATINGFRVSSSEEYISPEDFFGFSNSNRVAWIESVTNNILEKYRDILLNTSSLNKKDKIAKTGRLKQSLLYDLGVSLKR